MACENVEFETAILLIDHGAKAASCGAAALHLAVRRSDERTVEALLRGGAVTYVADSDDGATPLHLAAITGDATITSLLLRHNASHASRYKTSGEQPLHVAAIKSHADVARLLLAAGANIASVSTSGQTPLLAAAIHGSSGTATLQVLLAGGADVDAAWRLGATSLHELAARGRAEAVRLLLEHGARADLVDAYGDTALVWAASRGHVDIVRDLLKQASRRTENATASAAATTLLRPNKYGITALHAAAFGAHDSVLEAICTRLGIDAGAGTAATVASCEDAMAAADAFGASPWSLREAVAAAATAGDTDAASDVGNMQPRLASLHPPLTDGWAAAAARMVSPLERQLLVLGAEPASIDAGLLIHQLALAKQSLTFDRRVRAMLHSRAAAALLRAPGVLDAAACAALQRAVDADASVRDGLTDGMPEHTLHLKKAQLQALIGAEAVERLWSLPSRYQRQAAGVAAHSHDAEATSGERVAAAAPRAMEIFIRRFSLATRPWIKLHADVAAVTVNVALTTDTDSSDDEQGDDDKSTGDGSGRLLVVYDGAVRSLRRTAGEATVHPSSLLHGVSRVTAGGTRYTLILFYSV